MRRVYKNLCPGKISASIMAANMWKNILKNVESDNNKILYETLFSSFLQRNGNYFLNKPRTFLTAVAETAMGTPVHAQESADSKYVTALSE